MVPKNKIPITRLSRYYDNVDFEMELGMASEIIDDDANFTVVLYRIDKSNSNNDIYGESKAREIRFLPPIELKVLPKIEDAENKNYAPNGSMKYQQYGNLIFTVLNKQLEQKGVDIQYGDIIAYPTTEKLIKFFEVSDDGRINMDNKSTQFGFKSFFRTIVCVSVDPNQFNGI